MKIKIVTSANTVYAIDVESNDFDMVVEKILSKKFLKLNKNTVVLTSSIVEIQKI